VTWRALSVSPYAAAPTASAGDVAAAAALHAYNATLATETAMKAAAIAAVDCMGVKGLKEYITSNGGSLSVEPNRYCASHHRVPFTSRNESSKCVSMSWRAMGAVDIDHRVIRCRVTQGTRFKARIDDVASSKILNPKP